MFEEEFENLEEHREENPEGSSEGDSELSEDDKGYIENEFVDDDDN
jgi:hypothetical protein